MGGRQVEPQPVPIGADTQIVQDDSAFDRRALEAAVVGRAHFPLRRIDRPGFQLQSFGVLVRHDLEHQLIDRRQCVAGRPTPSSEDCEQKPAVRPVDTAAG